MCFWKDVYFLNNSRFFWKKVGSSQSKPKLHRFMNRLLNFHVFMSHCIPRREFRWLCVLCWVESRRTRPPRGTRSRCTQTTVHTDLKSNIRQVSLVPPSKGSADIWRPILDWRRVLGRNWDNNLRTFAPCYSQSPPLANFTPPFFLDLVFFGVSVAVGYLFHCQCPALRATNQSA
jgi:hypothetical protein